MKKIALILLVIISCNKEKIVTEKEFFSIKKRTNTLLDNWHLAASKAKYKDYFNAMDTDAVFIGTDASENWKKPDFQIFSKPYFDAGKAWSFKVIHRNIYINKTANFIWFDELLDTQMGLCRGSGVLEKKGISWKIKHYVLSITIPNDDVKTVVKIKKKKDSLYLQKFDTISKSM